MKKLLAILLTTGLLAACGNEEATTITPDEFKKVEEGMSVEDVKKVVGGEPESIRDIDAAGMVEYEYVGENGIEDDSYVALLFKDDKLDTIIERGIVTKSKPIDSEKQNVEPIEKQEVERAEEIEEVVKDKVESDYDSTSIKEITVNEDAGKGEGYIVLAYLSFDAKNRSKTTKDMVTMYGQDLGATLADQPDINEVTVFWEAPYLKEGDTVYKLNMQREGEGMSIESEYFDQSVFD